METLEHITIPAGPRFKNPLAVLLFLLILLLLYTGIISLLSGAVLFFLLQIALIIVLLNLILDFGGTEISRTRMQIRDYRQFLWFRMGTWSPLNNFVSLRLQVDFGIQRGSVGRCGGKGSSTAYYDVVLVNRNEKKTLLLKEFSSYNNALLFMEMYAKWLHLPAEDWVAKNRLPRNRC